MRELDAYIDQVKQLPPAPRILTELLVLLRRSDIDLSLVVDLIAYDPSLTAAVLKLCNSAYFGSSVPADNLYEAITRIGFYEAYRLVAAIVGSRTLSAPQKGYGLDSGELWRHSVTTAVAAQRIARHLGEDANVAFTTGLLHDLGKIVLAQAMEGRYEQVVAQIQSQGQSFLEAEKALLGVEHAEVGGRLLHRWNFPSPMVAAVRFHHDPAQAQSAARLAALIYVGNAIAHYLGEAYGHQPFAFRGRPEVLDLLGIQETDLEKYMLDTVEGLESVAGLMLKAL
jgi:putative nucleotidyltransferase with HDIG domain